jgi:hypothetical protein
VTYALPLIVSAYLLGCGLTEGIACRLIPGSDGEEVAVLLGAVWPLTLLAAVVTVLTLPVAIATGRLGSSDSTPR